MTIDLALVLALLGAAIVMFVANRPRMDAVAVIMMVALPFTGVLTVSEALSGLSNPNVVLIAALFIIGEGLVRTGIAQRLGERIVARAGGNEARLIVLLMVTVGLVGSVMSSTGVVALFIPVVLRVARSADLAPGRLMMPLSVAGLISGMMTLVATPPNLIVHSELLRQGFEGFGFFAITPFGVPLLVLAIVYMLFARRLLPGKPKKAGGVVRPHLSDWVEEYGLAEREGRLRIEAGSSLIGHRLKDLDLRSTSGVNVIAIERGRGFARHLIRPLAQTELHEGDILFLDVFVPTIDIDDVCQRFGLSRLPLSGAYFTDRSQEIGMAEMMVPVESSLIGRTVVEARFRSETDLAVVGLKRGRKAVTTSILDEPLKLGDTLLVFGPWRAIRALQAEGSDTIVLNLPAELDDALPAPGRAPYALGALALLVGLMVSGVVPNVQAALIACLVMGLFGCVDMTSAYRSIHWQSLVLIVGMLPFSLALQKTGGVDLAADALLSVVGDAGPRAVLVGIFIVTAAFSLFISNTATAVLMAPVAVAVAAELHASPYPFAMTVALAASSAFMTPVSSPVNTLVIGPGDYTFMDFVRVGVPFAAISLIATVTLVPWLLPF
ncbi:SLC13 family permease [Afifella marina]|uniref:Di-and tricarboxylate transporter n=1 Tax=Afifella marina DSM 2698 TaxID=1120955 RepID=A0A1G5M4Y3_AFIMA|nr:SLC13 family permease [Afifella marina]MBK1622966.1 SLC13 family permease [Afifella marina DSM 2698]MBK1625960.1 SLC13 family permease [Afifella marina]MBK5917784.1 SLC13 family permease [Afifella marina]RAI23692.1 SLC13 family permease [Afifella marina DSM 2698]SCZ20225.1 Di-and tricarboxylate transporter [Afifella marina DSM 2698]